MSDIIQKASGDDLLVWPDGTVCFRSEVGMYSHMSDDYEVVAEGTARWDCLLEKNYV